MPGIPSLITIHCFPKFWVYRTFLLKVLNRALFSESTKTYGNKSHTSDRVQIPSCADTNVTSGDSARRHISSDVCCTQLCFRPLYVSYLGTVKWLDARRQCGLLWRRRATVYLEHVRRESGRDGSVGVATRYGLDGPGDRMPVRARFSAPVQTGPRTHPTSYTMGTGSLPRG